MWNIFARAIIASKARTGTVFLSIMILLKFGAHIFTLGHFDQEVIFWAWALCDCYSSLVMVMSRDQNSVNLLM